MVELLPPFSPVLVEGVTISSNGVVNFRLSSESGILHLSAKIPSNMRAKKKDLDIFKEINTNTALAHDVTENNENIEEIFKIACIEETNAVAVTGKGKKKRIQFKSMLEDCKMLPAELEDSELISNRRGKRPTVSRKRDSILS